MPVTALRVADLRKLSKLMSDAMRLQVGPMALVERPEEQVLKQEAMRQAVAATVAGRPKVARHALSLMLRFEEMVVIPLGADAPEGTLTVGRAADCDVQTAHPSTSSIHARIRWDAWKRTAWISDLGSTNGSFVNGTAITAETPLAEGDVISLGEAAFLFVSFETLQALLKID